MGEEFRELVRVQNVVIEEIISSALPDSFEYRQPQDEWVVVLEGTARLQDSGPDLGPRATLPQGVRRVVHLCPRPLRVAPL